jgi:hypothetical protein
VEGAQKIIQTRKRGKEEKKEMSESREQESRRVGELESRRAESIKQRARRQPKECREKTGEMNIGLMEGC